MFSVGILGLLFAAGYAKVRTSMCLLMEKRKKCDVAATNIGITILI